jgi:hypothetical protein
VPFRRETKRATVSELAIAALCSAMLTTAALAQTGFRCGDQLIEFGTSRENVLAQCGEPAQVGEGFDEVGEGVAIPVEEWVYDFGPTTSPSVLVFRNGSLAEVRTSQGFPPS